MTPRQAVLLIAALLFFWQLGGRDLWAPDEPYFAEGAREMVADGEWVVPHVNGVVTTDKPPLFFWLIALFSLPAGAVTPLTARLPSALAALGTLLLTMRLGGRLLGPRGAALAGAVLATTYMFWDKARWSQIDSLLCCLIWVALSAFEAYRAGDAGGRGAGLLFWLAAALAVLAKGPVGVLLPVGIALVVLASEGNLGAWRRFAPLSGPALFIVTLGIWVAATELFGGDYSVWGALREHFVDRALHGMHHEQPVWYFLERLPPSLLPWTGLVPGALVLAWRRRTGGDRLLLAAALVVLVFFTLSTEKRELYALPALPAFALLVAGLVAFFAGWNEPATEQPLVVDRRWMTIGQGVLCALLALVGLALPAAAGWVEEIAVAQVVPVAVALAGGALAGLLLLARRRALAAALAPAAGVALVYFLLPLSIYPAFETSKSARPFSERLREVSAVSRAAGHEVLAFDLGNLPEAFAFYTDGLYTVETTDPARLARHFEGAASVFAAVNGEATEALPAGLRERLWVVESTRLARREVLLLTNAPYPGAAALGD